MRRDQILKVPGLECDITLLDSVDSTSEWVLQQIRFRRTFPFACFAEAQTQGRGRRGRSWTSPPHSNIYMSFAWEPDFSLSEIGVLSIGIGLAVIKVLEDIGIMQPRLKWPNDVLVDGKKIAGILIETAKNNDGSLIVVIGIGLNYNWSGACEEKPDQPWTDVVSLLKVGAAIDRGYLSGLLLRQCMEMCELYPHNKASLLREYQAGYDVCLHRSVDVTLDSGLKLNGIAIGVTPAGEIRVLINGEEQVFSSADISLRYITGDM